jgi:hypothetical protein
VEVEQHRDFEAFRDQLSRLLDLADENLTAAERYRFKAAHTEWLGSKRWPPGSLESRIIHQLTEAAIDVPDRVAELEQFVQQRLAAKDV